MPRNNRKNKNRGPPAPLLTSAGAVARNDVSLSSSSKTDPILTTGMASMQGIAAGSLVEAKAQLNQLQESVDTIKVTIGQLSANAKIDNKPDGRKNESTPALEITADQGADATKDEPFETQTMKRKRNRNRNRKKNASSGGESENGSSADTHENSPTVSTAASQIVISKVEEEPIQQATSKNKPRSDKQILTNVDKSECNQSIQSVAEAVPPKEMLKNEAVELLALEKGSPILKKIDDPEENSNIDNLIVQNVKTGPVAVEKSLKKGKKQNITENLGAAAESATSLNLSVQHEDKMRVRDTNPIIESKKSPKLNKKQNNKPAVKEVAVEDQSATKIEMNLIDALSNVKKIDHKQVVAKASKELDVEDQLTMRIEDNLTCELSDVQKRENNQEVPLDTEQVIEAIADTNLARNSPQEPSNSINPPEPNVCKSAEKDEDQKKIPIEKDQVPPEPKVSDTTIKTTKLKNKKKLNQDKISSAPTQNAESPNLSAGEKIAELNILPETSESRKETEQVEVAKPFDIAKEIKATVQPDKLDVEVKINTLTQSEAAIGIANDSKVIQTVPLLTMNSAKDKEMNEFVSTKQKIEKNVNLLDLNLVKTSTLDEPILTHEPEPRIDANLIEEPEPSIDAKNINDDVQIMTKTPSTTPVKEALSKSTAKISEDETAKIWKILEEASKSFEPVEIQLEDEPISPPNTSVKLDEMPLLPISSPIDKSTANEAAKNLIFLLDTKSPKKEGPSGTTTSTKINKPHVAAITKSDHIAAMTVDQKAVETQPRKSADAKKKEAKAPKAHKLGKQCGKINKPAPQIPPDKPPITEIPDIEIPLDMSVITAERFESDSDLLSLPHPLAEPTETTSETTTDSKNVQGSGFVPFVKQLTDATKSLVPAIVSESTTNADQMQRKSTSPATNKRNKNEINLKQSLIEAKSIELTESSAQLMIKPQPQITDVQFVDILEAKMIEPHTANAKNENKNTQLVTKQPLVSEIVNENIKTDFQTNSLMELSENKIATVIASRMDAQQLKQILDGQKLELKEENNCEQTPKMLPNAIETNSVDLAPSATNCDIPSTSSPPTSNIKKSKNKPNVPPKPDHLIISSNKPKSPLPPKTIDKKQSTERMPKPQSDTIGVDNNKDEDDEEEDFIEYKFMPRQVFICTICQSCKTPTKPANRILCQSCQMVSYCSAEHCATDEPIHRELCSAIQEIAKKRGGHIYNNARILNNNDYRSLRVHTLNICENLLKRPLQTYERETLLFPRLCATANCREWRQNLLSDCKSCGQVFYCTAHPDHLVDTHQQWCKAFELYQTLVVTQSISGRIEPSLPSRIQTKPYTLPNNIDDVFKDLYKNYSAIKDDCVYATLTQLATAPLTAFFAAQRAEQKIGERFTIHLVGAELQFEADILDIWETFFLHLAHKLVELTIVFCGPELNAENIPLDIISRIRMCRTCRQNCRIVKFDFQCAKLYHDYTKSSSFKKPDLICFFNPGLYRTTGYNGMDTWPETIKVATNQNCAIVITSYTEYESPRDLERFQAEAPTSDIDRQITLVHPPQLNVFASQRPERNFISDEVAPLIFKNFYCFILK